MNTTYKSNYLKQVIYRLDFPKIDIGSFDDFKKKSDNQKHNYSLDSQKRDNFTFNVTTAELDKTQDSVVIWRVNDEQMSMKFEATNEYCLLEYTQYVDSTRLKKDAEMFILNFLKMHNIEEVSRIGLRYINQIMSPSIKKFSDWSKYIASDLLNGSLYIQGRLGAPLRYLNQIELNPKDNSLVSVSFKYGIWNDKYPSPITSADYILDIDCFTRSPILVNNDLETTYADLNSAAEIVFEASIQESLRKEMNK
ncbi:MAG: hypothetical protein PWQ10_198 [Patescibacteria group bacterium]|nr:hypothetical protein [Patescibacteria group bacterium]